MKKIIFTAYAMLATFSISGAGANIDYYNDYSLKEFDTMGECILYLANHFNLGLMVDQVRVKQLSCAGRNWQPEQGGPVWANDKIRLEWSPMGGWN